LIGIVVLVLALVVTVRSRRRDLALLQVFGFKRAELTGTVMSEAGVFGVVGIVVGTPLGLIIGRVVWLRISDALGVSADPAVPAKEIVLTALAVLVGSILVSLIPATRAARRPPGEILHRQ
jgi:putative ABC transport system permease protein